MLKLIVTAMKPAERLQLLLQIAVGAAGLVGTLYSLHNKSRGGRAVVSRLSDLQAKIVAVGSLVNDSKKTPASAKKSLGLAEALYERVTNLLCGDSDPIVLNEMIDQAYQLIELAEGLAKQALDPADQGDKVVLKNHESMLVWAARRK